MPPFPLLTMAVISLGAPAAPLDGPALAAPPADLADDIPPTFTRFVFPGNDEAAQLLNRYTWHHFSKRLGNGRVLFNKEYLMVSDLWLAGATDAKRGGLRIQDVHRQDLGAVEIDADGYVHSHQHFSHAHDHGWPFPLWPQVPGGHRGFTAGWHFQDDGPDWQWIWPMIRGWGAAEHYTVNATLGWELENAVSHGLVDGRWRVESTGPSPALITPASITIDAFNAPFVQLRWKRSGASPTHALPYIEWRRAEDDGFGPERRVYFTASKTEHSAVTGVDHAIIPMHAHPLWTGAIAQMRLSLAPGESGVVFDLDSFFTCYDTRHTINNPILILAAWEYFRWTGDLAFLRENANRLRTALRYMLVTHNVEALHHARNPWVGHDGQAGYVLHDDGGKTYRPGHGIGNNYWDLMPFGHDDFYATAQCYAALVAMAELEEAAATHPGWGVPGGAWAQDPQALRLLAQRVKEKADALFWSDETGRFIACIDADGKRHDYGYTFLNLDAIWYGIAKPERARAILDWLDGRRIVAGDTSTGADIYHWRFGPRATTRRNVEWYGQGWTAPESIAWGGQVQDGGAVLGFAFYDLWARLHVLGPDNAWERLMALLAWERDVWAAGGYRAYYADGRHGTTLQGGGTAGGLGIDQEFFESSLIPAIVTRGWLGLRPTAEALHIAPRLPSACPRMGARNLLYRNVRFDIDVSHDDIVMVLHDAPVDSLQIAFDRSWTCSASGQSSSCFSLGSPGRYAFRRG